MALYKIPLASTLVDTQFIQIEGPDELTTGYQYDLETKTLWFKESQIIIPSFHGLSHIAEDPIPEATVDVRGLMAADDKAKLESLIQMRLGVLGMMGSGYPDAGGWLQGDIILAAGSELISIERIGNVIRFSVDSSTPFNCGQEACAQIFWIQDESATRAIRPPACAGVLPDVNMYGMLSVYLLPESTVVDPNNVLDTLKNKDDYPALRFRRCEDSTTPSLGQFEMVLRRAVGGTSIAGHTMTPGDPAQGQFADVVWFTGLDDDGNRIRFDFQSESEPGLLGALLFKGHTLTRKMGVVTAYTSTILSTNQYTVKYWDILNEVPVGSSFAATNIWRYNNPENEFTDASDPKSLALDGYGQLLTVGTLVQLWEMKIGDTVVRRYFNLEPPLSASVIWDLADAIRFGDALVSADSTATDNAANDVRVLEHDEWGTTWYENPFYVVDGDALAGPLANQFTGDIDYALPGLTVTDHGDADRITASPVFLWHRRNYDNLYANIMVGQPDNSNFPPIDILMRAPIDSYGNVFMRIVDDGTIGSGEPYIIVSCDCVSWDQLPSAGTLQLVTALDGTGSVVTWSYTSKAWATTGIMLIGTEVFPAVDVTVADFIIAMLVHEDYNVPCLRLEFSVNQSAETVQLQFRAGMLDMTETYALAVTGVNDGEVHDFDPTNYSESRWYEQDGFITQAENPTSDPANFRCYMGGFLATPIGDQTERWNELEILLRGDQLWVWWNDLLIPPATGVVAVNTPYFPMTTDIATGKFGFRLWPGARLRSASVSSQAALKTEFLHGQLQITT